MGGAPDIAGLRDRRLLRALTATVADAAAAIDRLGRAAQVRHKADCSPVTQADEAAEAVILEGLARILPGVPVVSEERAGEAPPLAGSVFCLVDPLDGTREYVAGRDEFTVNVAVIVDRTPLIGVIAAPVLKTLWRGTPDGAERLALAQGHCGEGAPIRVRAWPAKRPVAFVSRSHLDAASAALIDRIPDIERRPCGSALKFCRLAEGAGDLYPRLAPTSEWDVAAGHALLAAAGGAVTKPNGEPLVYGDAAGKFHVPAFMACGDPAAARRFAAG